jgi:hypothetical protein
MKAAEEEEEGKNKSTQKDRDKSTCFLFVISYSDGEIKGDMINGFVNRN